MNKFLRQVFRFLLTGIIALLFLLSMYTYLDPFKVLRTYETYYDENSKGWVALNRDFVSTSSFINNNDAENYNSFILGNSRSIAYQVDDWKKFLGPETNGFHFDASGESLWALNKKIEFIDKQGNNLKNVLLVLDHETIIQDEPREGHLFVISPPLVNDSNKLEFHKTFFTTFLHPKFFVAVIDFKLFGKVRPYMTRNRLIYDIPIDYDVKTNDIRYTYFERLIEEDRYYTPERLSEFYERDTSAQRGYSKSIYDHQEEIFTNIKTITEKHDSNINIIISPLYDQKKLHPEDLNYLTELFGKDHVYDFSGINAFTNDYKNYYDPSHYRPHMARELLKKVYR